MEQPFKHEALEQEINRLSQEVRERHAESGAERADESTVREALRQRVYQEAPPAGGPASGQTPAGDDGASSILPAYLKKESPEIKLKVEELLDLTLHRGIDKVVEEARQYGPFVLDAYHDALTTKLYGELKNRGLI